MPIFDVEITRKIELRATVRIEAPDEASAREAAIEFEGKHLSDAEMDAEGDEHEAKVKGLSEDDGPPDYAWGTIR